MLENILNKTKIGITTALFALSMYSCASTKVSSPVVDYVKNKFNYRSECMEWDKYERICLQPVIVVNF
ncbi:hypothetical protein J4440_03690 [Candidatus Woesearchaeota archaeon]|nr:hypothetical protein [Candidatus Woesearchaeota archaeon]